MKRSWEISDSQVWNFNEIVMGRAVSTYVSKYETHHSSNVQDTVRLHMGLRGDYSFSCRQFSTQWDLIGGHHNIMYANGMDLEIYNKSIEIETFGVQFPKQLFVHLSSDEDEMLSRFSDKVLKGESVVLSENWGSINAPIQSVLDEIINNPYQGSLQNIFLFGKTLELLVLCIADYKDKLGVSYNYLKTVSDKEAIIAARDYINDRISEPPGLSEIARYVGVNEFKLKYGFREMFGIPIFSYLIQKRLSMASTMLRDTDKSIGEISEILGYSSPQHFSSQYKEKVGMTPSEWRKGV